MKNLKVLLALFIGLALFSCKKEEVEPDLGPYREAYEFDSSDDYQIDCRTFVLIGGKTYMENVSTGEKVVYDHFDDNKTVSGMRLGKYEYEIERLEKDVTTWGFFSPDRLLFVLNGDSLDPYEATQSSYSSSIIEHSQATIDGPITMKMGGSAKPFTMELVDRDQDIIRFFIHEAYTTIDGEQWTYFNALDFQLVD